MKFEIREVASDSLWVELLKMLDVPRVGDFQSVRVDQSIGSCVRITGVSDPRGGGVNRVANRFSILWLNLIA